MSPYKITCCSTVDVPEELLKSLDIEYTYFHYEVDGKIYNDDFGKSMSSDELFKTMLAGADTKTSQVGVGEYIDFFTKILDEGNDIFHISLSSGISGSYNSAVLAKSQLEETYPDRKIVVIDSLAASGGYGLLVTTLAKKKADGCTMHELEKWTEENKLHLNHWFFTSDLTFFIRGGRVSKTAGLIGNALNICPLLNVSNEGKLIPRKKIRTTKKVIKETLNTMKELASNGVNYKGKVYITHSLCYDDARALADLIEETFPNIDGKVQISDIGATIGSHTGPGTVALFFWGQKREN
ncbi:MAG: DegV family protein [Lachnospiraceae bacterium]|nr:DegV family protein [Lachnospiraceae bacterium]